MGGALDPLVVQAPLLLAFASFMGHKACEQGLPLQIPVVTLSLGVPLVSAKEVGLVLQQVRVSLDRLDMRVNREKVLVSPKMVLVPLGSLCPPLRSWR